MPYSHTKAYKQACRQIQEKIAHGTNAHPEPDPDTIQKWAEKAAAHAFAQAARDGSSAHLVNAGVDPALAAQIAKDVYRKRK